MAWPGGRRLCLITDGDGRLFAAEIAAALGQPEAIHRGPDDPLPADANAILAVIGGTASSADRLLQSLADVDVPVALCIAPDLIDRAYAVLDSPDVALLCQPTLGEAVSAAALALATGPATAVAEDGDRAALRRLSHEAARIAQALAAIADRGEPTPAVRPHAPVAQAPADAAERFRRMLRERRLRDGFFATELFADPAWDMLLDLAAAKAEGRAVSVSSLCIAAAVPPTTALRWIRALTDAGLFERVPDPADRRRTFIAATVPAAAAMAAYLEALNRLDATTAAKMRTQSGQE